MKVEIEKKIDSPVPSKDFVLSFRDFKIIELSFSLNPAYKGWDNEAKNWQGVTFEHDVEYELAHNFNAPDKALRVFLAIKAIAKDAPFNVSVKGIGLFFVSEIPEQEKINIFARINCAAIVFPYLRETIADVTRRAGFPILHLQPVNFVKMYNDFVESQKREIKETKEAATKVVA